MLEPVERAVLAQHWDSLLTTSSSWSSHCLNFFHVVPPASMTAFLQHEPAAIPLCGVVPSNRGFLQSWPRPPAPADPFLSRPPPRLSCPFSVTKRSLATLLEQRAKRGWFVLRPSKPTNALRRGSRTRLRATTEARWWCRPPSLPLLLPACMLSHACLTPAPSAMQQQHQSTSCCLPPCYSPNCPPPSSTVPSSSTASTYFLLVHVRTVRHHPGDVERRGATALESAPPR